MMTFNFLLLLLTLITLSLNSIHAQDNPYQFEQPLSVSEFLNQDEAPEGKRDFFQHLEAKIKSLKNLAFLNIAIYLNFCAKNQLLKSICTFNIFWHENSYILKAQNVI